MKMNEEIKYEAQRFFVEETGMDTNAKNSILALGSPRRFKRSLMSRLEDFITGENKYLFLSHVRNFLTQYYELIPLTEDPDSTDYRSSYKWTPTILDKRYQSSLFYIDQLINQYPKTIVRDVEAPDTDKPYISIFYSLEDQSIVKELGKHIKAKRYSSEIKELQIMENGRNLNINFPCDEALTNSQQIIFLCSASLLASEFWFEYAVYENLMRAQSEGTTIFSLILKPCDIENSTLSLFQTINSPSRTVQHLSEIERETLWVHLIKQILNIQSQNHVYG